MPLRFLACAGVLALLPLPLLFTGSPSSASLRGTTVVFVTTLPDRCALARGLRTGEPLFSASESLLGSASTVTFIRHGLAPPLLGESMITDLEGDELPAVDRSGARRRGFEEGAMFVDSARTSGDDIGEDSSDVLKRVLGASIARRVAMLSPRPSHFSRKYRNEKVVVRVLVAGVVELWVDFRVFVVFRIGKEPLSIGMHAPRRSTASRIRLHCHLLILALSAWLGFDGHSWVCWKEVVTQLY